MVHETHWSKFSKNLALWFEVFLTQNFIPLWAMVQTSWNPQTNLWKYWFKTKMTIQCWIFEMNSACISRPKFSYMFFKHNCQGSCAHNPTLDIYKFPIPSCLVPWRRTRGHFHSINETAAASSSASFSPPYGWHPHKNDCLGNPKNT